MITVRDLGNLVIYAGAVAAALAAIAVVARYVVLQPLKRWLAREIRRPVEAIGAEVGADTKGPTLKDALLATSYRVTSLERRFEDHLNNHPGSPP